MKWIKSAGGPLICLESRLMPLWCGVDGAFQKGNCVSTPHSDYDRACAIRDYAGLVDVCGDRALVLGDLPMATTVFRKAQSEICLVRAIYMEPNTDIAQFISDLSKPVEVPLEILDLETHSDKLALFDSAFPGGDSNKEVLEFPLFPGRYKIKTALFDPDAQTSLVLHQFELQDNV